jgi:lipopolysaccharide export system permease protein
VTLISRYVFREAFGAWLVVMAVLFAILMSNEFAEILRDAATDEVPKDAVLAIFALTSLSYVTALTPPGLFLGVMLALARLHRDSEMAALSSCGVGPGRLLRPVGLLAVALAGSVAWLALTETPNAVRRIEEIKLEAQEAMQLAVIQPGRFTSPDSGETVLYAREVSGAQIRGVFWQRQRGDRVIAIVADRGVRTQDPVTGQMSFTLYGGRLYDGVPGERRFLVAEFDEQYIPVRANEDSKVVEVVAGKSTAALVTSADPFDRAELQWRISYPLQALVLALLAIPLSQSAPREGRYGRVGAGLLIYITYANLLSIARVWVERGDAAEWLGMWWVHALFGAVAMALFVRATGWLARSRMLVAPAR